MTGIFIEDGVIFIRVEWGSLSSGADGAFLAVNQEPHSLPAIRGKMDGLPYRM
jgi:hypothetical protein